MPQSSGLYEAPLLAKLAQDIKNRQFIAPDVLTPVIVPNKQGKYFKWDQGVTFKEPRTKYGQDGSPGMIDVKGTKASFSLDTHALSAFVDPEEIEQAPEAQVRQFKLQKLVELMQMRLELDVAAQLTSTSVITQNTTLAGAAQWSDPSSDPIAAILAQQDNLPRQGNTLIGGREAITKLRQHTKVLTAIQYTKRGGVAPLADLAELFGVERILIGDAFKDTAAEGLAASKSRIWGKDVILAYIDPSPPSALMDQPTLGYLPRLKGQANTPWSVYTADDPMRGTGKGREFLKVEMSFGVLVSAPSMAFLWKNAVA